MLTPDQEKLKEAALAATQGKWARATGYAVVCEVPNVRHHNDYAVLDGSKFLQIATTIHGSLPGRDAEFISLANPAAILAILAQLEQVQQGAARYKWLRNRAPDTIASIAWSVPAACLFGAPDQAVDAAMEAKPLPPPPEAA